MRALYRPSIAIFQSSNATASVESRVLSTVRSLGSRDELNAAISDWVTAGLPLDDKSIPPSAKYKAVVTALRFHNATDTACTFTRAWLGALGHDAVDEGDFIIPIESALETLDSTGALAFLAVLREAGIDEHPYIPIVLGCTVKVGSLKESLRLLDFCVDNNIEVPYNVWWNQLRLAIYLGSYSGMRRTLRHAIPAGVPKATLPLMMVDATVALLLRLAIRYFLGFVIIIGLLSWLGVGIPKISQRLRDKAARNAELEARRDQLQALSQLTQ